MAHQMGCRNAKRAYPRDGESQDKIAGYSMAPNEILVWAAHSGKYSLERALPRVRTMRQTLASSTAVCRPDAHGGFFNSIARLCNGAVLSDHTGFSDAPVISFSKHAS